MSFYEFELFSLSFFRLYHFNCLSAHVRRMFLLQFFHLLKIHVKPKKGGSWLVLYRISLNYCFSSLREPIFIACFLDKSGVFEFSKATSHSEQRLTSFARDLFRR